MDTRDDIPARESILISSAARGDFEAFNQLVLKYQDLVYNVARSILADDESAEDAAQESFISAFQHVASFRGGSFRSWLLRITTNTCYDFLRSHRRRPTVPLYPVDGDGNEIDSPSWLADPDPSPQAKLESEEFSQALYGWLDDLPAPFRAVITLIDVNEIDYEEAARVLGIPIGTVKSRLARARLRMKERISQELGSAERSGWRTPTPQQRGSALSL